MVDFILKSILVAAVSVISVNAGPLIVESDVYSKIAAPHTNALYNDEKSYQAFINSTAKIGPKSKILKEMATSGRTIQMYISDGFKSGTDFRIKQWGDNYLAFSKDKEYLTNNDFYVIDFYTAVDVKNTDFTKFALKDTQRMLLEWKSAVDNYNEKSFEKVLKAVSSKVTPGSYIYSSALNTGYNPSKISWVNIMKVKNKGDEPKGDAKGSGFYFIKTIGLTNADLKKNVAAVSKDLVLFSDTRVLVSGEELSRINKYLDERKNMIRFPFAAKLDCMTKIKEDYHFNILVNASQKEPTKIKAVSFEESLKNIKNMNK